MGDPETLAWYQREAPSYTLHFGMAPSRFLDPFLDRLAPGATILELGTGGGRDLAHMLKRGFAVDATDGVPAMARKAAERTGHQVRVMRFDELEAEAAYDAVWAHAALHHQPLASLGDVLARIARALKPGGLFFANYKLGLGDSRDMFGRLYNFAPRPLLLDAYAGAGLELVDVHDYRDGGLDKVLRDWIAIIAQRPPGD